MATDPISAALKAVLDRLKSQQQQQPGRDPTIPPGFGRPDPFAPTLPQGSIPIQRQSQSSLSGEFLDRQLAQEAATRAQQVAAQAAPSGGSMLVAGGTGSSFSRPASAPAYPQEPAYQRPAPIFSEGDFQRQMESDFNYARRAADVAVQNQLRLTGGSQRDLIGEQFAGQRSLINTQATAQRGLMGGTQADLMNNQAANQARLMDAAANSQIRTAGGTQRQLLNDQFAAQSNQQRSAADQNLRNQSALMAQSANAQQAMNRTVSRGGAGALNYDRNIQVALNNERMKLEFEQLQRQRKGLSGGGKSGGSGGGGSIVVQQMENPAVALQRDRLAAQERAQAADLAGRERMQAADIAARAALAVQAGQNRQTEIQTQGQTEDELRRKAAMRALEVFSGANPRGRQLSLSNSGRVA